MTKEDAGSSKANEGIVVDRCNDKMKLRLDKPIKVKARGEHGKRARILDDSTHKSSPNKSLKEQRELSSSTYLRARLSNLQHAF